MDYLKPIIDFFTENIWNPGSGDFLGAVMFACLTGILIFFRKSLKNGFSLFLRLREQQVIIPQALRHYKNFFEEETLRLNHSWKLDEQSLKDLIVPVNIQEKGEYKRIVLSNYINQKYADNGSPRFLLLGDAGSGKSVAMGVIAREIWKVERERILLPVLLTFSEIKTVNSAVAFEQAIVKVLERYQFENGKRNQKAEEYVQENLYSGNILILLDGFDELEKSVRLEIGKFLNQYFQTHTSIPFIVSCRKAVWRQNSNIFNSLNCEEIVMADFTPFEIKQFVYNWKFIGKKSPEKLNELINEKTYLRNIATNPLMLTIIAFVYAQPKRILPDNRVKFYDECIDALMEKWDNAKLLERANQFETIDKSTILSRLAYEQIVNAKSTDRDILKSEVLRIIGEEMKKLSRPVEKRQLMLNEIVLNSELLIELPPDAYKFPHRTFMEYFAAKYFYTEKGHESLLNLFSEDKGKWQETLALYCGLNENSKKSDEILQQLRDNFISTQDDSEPDTFVFTALVESAKVSPVIADEILDIADSFLKNNINLDIIENLGYIAMNPNWEHNKKAKQILLKQFSKELSDSEFQQVVFALININDDEIQNLIFNHLNRINLSEFLIKTGTETEKHVIKLIEKLPETRLEEVFIGLKEAREFEILFSLMTQSEKEEVKQNAAFFLSLSSRSDAFFVFLDRCIFKNVSPKIDEISEKLLDRYGWNKRKIESENGKKGAFLIAYLSAEYIIEQEFNADIYQKNREVHNWFRFLISAILHEKGFDFSKYNLINIPFRATKRGLLNNWKGNMIIRDSSIYVSIILLYIIMNIIGLFKYWSHNWLQVGIGISTLLPILLIFNLEHHREKNIYSINNNSIVNIVRFLLLLSMPVLLFSDTVIRLIINDKTAYNPIFYLALGVILSFVFILTPIPTLYKNINLVMVGTLTIFSVLNCYLNPFFGIFQNEAIEDFIKQ